MFKSRNNSIEFISPTPIFEVGQQEAYKVYEFEIKSFTTNKLLILEKGESLLKNYNVISNDDGTFNIQFQDNIQNVNAQYIAISEDKIKMPLKVGKVLQSSGLNYHSNGLQNFSSDAKMLLLTTDMFINDAISYKSFKELCHSTGWVQKWFHLSLKRDFYYLRFEIIIFSIILQMIKEIQPFLYSGLMVSSGAMDGKERTYSGRMVSSGAMDGKERAYSG